MKTSRWILLLAALFAAALLGAFALKHAGGARLACVYLDGELIRTLDLAAVTGEYQFTVECAAGYNVLAVRPGGICVREADCHDNTCVKQGWLEGGITPIVCLPHGLVIRIEAPEFAPEPELDAIAG